MQVGLHDEAAPSAVLVETTTADGMYRYRLHADDAVVVAKRTPEGGWETAYIYVVGGCNCPGFAHRNECKHADLARALLWWWAERTTDMA